MVYKVVSRPRWTKFLTNLSVAEKIAAHLRQGERVLFYKQFDMEYISVSYELSDELIAYIKKKNRNWAGEKNS